MKGHHRLSLAAAAALVGPWAAAQTPTTAPSVSHSRSTFGTGPYAPWGIHAGADDASGFAVDPATRPSGQPVRFMGADASAESVVYLCDASGSMVSVFGQVKIELKRSVDGLAVDENGAQKFNVIFFHDSQVDVLFKDGPQLATADNKARARDYIDGFVSVGGTDPLPAIKLTLAERPEQIFLLTDGFDQIADMATVVDPFKRAGGTTHVDCVFLQSDPDPKLVDALKQIAAIGHGTMRTILKKDM